MSRRLLLPGLLALLVLVAPLAAAQSAAPPEGATVATTENLSIAHWVGNQSAVDAEVEAGRTATLWFGVSPLANRTAPPAASGNGTDDGGAAANGTATDGNGTDDPATNVSAWVAVVQLDAAQLAFTQANLTLLVPESPGAWGFGFTQVSTADVAPGPLQYAFTVTLHEGSATGPVVETFTGTGTIDIQEVEVPAPPTGLPLPLLVGALAVLVLGAGAGAYALRQRRERARMERAPRRSQALREAQLEQRLERAKAKERPEEAQQIQQEIRQQERVRETRRELQILEAKRADAVKTLELLRKRHEAGGLTKLQYENMAAKKQADLDRIEREIAEMRAQDDEPGAAA